MSRHAKLVFKSGTDSVMLHRVLLAKA